MEKAETSRQVALGESLLQTTKSKLGRERSMAAMKQPP
jgi:hypothetical protein